MKDKNLPVIKSVVSSNGGDFTAYLFGSRSKGTNRPDSDYDILVEVNGDPDIRDRISLSSKITKMLADRDIIADVLVESKLDISIKKNLTGSIVRNALKTAVKL